LDSNAACKREYHIIAAHGSRAVATFATTLHTEIDAAPMLRMKIQSQRGSMLRAFGPAFFVIGVALGVAYAMFHRVDSAPQTSPTNSPAHAMQSKPPEAPPDAAIAASPAAALISLVPNSDQHVGVPAGDFNLPDANGNLVSLASYRGKIVMVNFWATWCGTCMGEMPSLEALYRDLKDRRDFALVTISVDQEGWSIIAPFLKAKAYDFPVLADAESRVSAAYGVTMLPTTFIVDRNGRIVWNVAGGLDWSNPAMRAALEKLFPIA
jgi:peroxiredoxin